MDNSTIKQRYIELHGHLLNQKPGLLGKLNSLLVELDAAGIHDTTTRELKRLELFERELDPSLELTELRSIVCRLYPINHCFLPRDVKKARLTGK